MYFIKKIKESIICRIKSSSCNFCPLFLYIHICNSVEINLKIQFCILIFNFLNFATYQHTLQWLLNFPLLCITKYYLNIPLMLCFKKGNMLTLASLKMTTYLKPAVFSRICKVVSVEKYNGNLNRQD